MEPEAMSMTIPQDRRFRWSVLHWPAFFVGLGLCWGLLYLMGADGASTVAQLCGPGTGWTGFAVLVGMWVLMGAGMMLPTALPVLRTFRDMTLGRDDLLFPAFVFGYVALWGAYALGAAALQRLLATEGWAGIEGFVAEPWVVAVFLAVAGLYQLSPLKRACLRACRAPMSFLFGAWKPGRGGAVHMGARLGAVCVGCCWALMALSIVAGTMNLAWMGAAMVVMALEKVEEVGRFLTGPLATVLLLGAAWQTAVALSMI
jgi:predicted metal-binding membrane protein